MATISLFGHKNKPITFLPNIGLDAIARQAVVDMLNVLLADEAVLAQKTRRAAEPGREAGSAELPSLCDGQYRQIKDIIAEIKERISILGGSHAGASPQSNAIARLDGNLTVIPDAIILLADHETFIRNIREDARKCFEDYEDQGTFAMLVTVMQIHERIAWILRSYIQGEVVIKLNTKNV